MGPRQKTGGAPTSHFDRAAQVSEARTRFLALDSWRGVCAVLVALYHINVIGGMYTGHFRSAAVINNAFLFVDFFFVLSGFVIAHSAIGKLNCAADIVPFLIRRFGRVWPLHMAVLAAFIGHELLKVYARRHGIATDTQPFAKNRSLPAIFTNILLVHSVGVHAQLKWNPPSWSISVEFYTYVVFSLLLVAWRRHLAVLSALVAALAAIVVAEFSKYNIQTTVQFGFFRCLYGFFVGVLTYLLYRTGRLPALAEQPRATAWEILVVATAAIFVMRANNGTLSLFAPLIFGATVYVFSSERGMMSKLLLTRPFRAAGERSYSIYMTHALILIATADLVRTVQRHFGAERHIDAIVEGKHRVLLYLGNDWLCDAMVVFFLITLCAVSSITYSYIENPARIYFNNIAYRKWRLLRH